MDTIIVMFVVILIPSRLVGQWNGYYSHLDNLPVSSHKGQS